MKVIGGITHIYIIIPKLPGISSSTSESSLLIPKSLFKEYTSEITGKVGDGVFCS